jgi:hypothetical protein
METVAGIVRNSHLNYIIVNSTFPKRKINKIRYNSENMGNYAVDNEQKGEMI